MVLGDTTMSSRCQTATMLEELSKAFQVCGPRRGFGGTPGQASQQGRLSEIDDQEKIK